MKPQVISTHIHSFNRTLRGGQPVKVFARSEQWESGTVATFITAVEDITTGEDITSQFSTKEMNDFVWEAIQLPR